MEKEKTKKEPQKRKRRSEVVVVTGSRFWRDRVTLRNRLRKLDPDTLLIHGGCDGLDKMAAEIWKGWGRATFCCEALWKYHGKSAGPIRNGWMLALMPDRVLAFHKDLKNSKGTKDCIKQAKRLNIDVEKIK